MGGGPSTVQATVVPVISSPEMFPGNHPTEFCLCASGGGSRAMSYTLGVYRALWKLNVIQKLDGISSVSGGTWASSVFMFGKNFRGQNIDTATMLGGMTNPSSLTLEVLKAEAPPLAWGLTQARSTQLFIKNAAKDVLKPLADKDVWTKTVADLVLEPWGLESMDACMALSEDDVSRIRSKNPQLGDTKFCTLRSDRPRLFLMNGTLLAPAGFQTNGDAIVSFQASPDFSGSPFYPMDGLVDYRPDVNFNPASVLFCFSNCCRQDLMVPVGGGLVESFAFGGQAPDTMPEHAAIASVGRPERPLSLADAVGISSYAPASALANDLFTQRNFSMKKEYWPVIGGVMLSPLHNMARVIPAREYQFGDGGSIDNSGLLPLLQRNARNVIYIATSYRALSTTYDFETVTQEDFDPDAALVVDQLFSLFGYGMDDQTQGFFNSHNQVFQKAALLPIVQKIAGLKKQGKPAVIRETLEVLPNKYWGIKGGYNMTLVLIYLETVQDFQDQLPAETRQEIARGSEGAFANFPIYHTNNNNGLNTLDLTAAQVNLLAAQAEYSVMQNEGLIKQFMASAKK
eukprot:s1818_g16.t1